MAVDLQFDATTDGRPVKLVSIVDEHTRECLTSLVERSVTADVLIDELDRLALTRGYPAVLRCDNGPELACEAMADWAGERVGLSFIPPGEPWRNGYVCEYRTCPVLKDLTLATSDHGVFDSICRSFGAGDLVEPAEQS